MPPFLVVVTRMQPWHLFPPFPSITKKGWQVSGRLCERVWKRTGYYEYEYDDYTMSEYFYLSVRQHAGWTCCVSHFTSESVISLSPADYLYTNNNTPLILLPFVVSLCMLSIRTHAFPCAVSLCRTLKNTRTSTTTTVVEYSTTYSLLRIYLARFPPNHSSHGNLYPCYDTPFSLLSVDLIPSTGANFVWGFRRFSAYLETEQEGKGVTTTNHST